MHVSGAGSQRHWHGRGRPGPGAPGESSPVAGVCSIALRWRVVLDLLRVVLPLGLSAAVSPVMLSEQAVLVGGPNGRRTGSLYAAGTLLVLAVVIVAVTLLGRAVALPSAPHLDATADLVLGVVLLGSAVVVARVRSRRPAQKGRSTRGPMGPSMAFGFGVVSMATNVTTLTVVVVAAKDVSAAGSPIVASAAALGLLAVLAAMPAWVPVLLAVLPGRSTMALAAISDQVSRHGRQLAVVVLILVGAFLVVRGIVRLAGL